MTYIYAGSKCFRVFSSFFKKIQQKMKSLNRTKTNKKKNITREKYNQTKKKKKKKKTWFVS